ncbi:sensor domain-containing phosphodiesterase [Sphingomonas faeni]|uniref:sensor domain-containing phosphodiesterase n=1 Tax=Sphingomonas faeni TaxID=185950 RepID=UPI00277F4531|nr:GGDEF domain-containing protein [Sphingomonas faeni]MDQ0839363.1 diguanylate cyclase (GGDEF)-like protein [Sphingomonas faeni]
MTGLQTYCKETRSDTISILLHLQNIILRMIAKGTSLEPTCGALCREVERILPEVVCSVLTVDPAGLLHPLAGPSLPGVYSQALDGLLIGPLAGSCGTAAYLKTDVTVTDIETDVRWAEHKYLALPHGLRACWSSPICDTDGRAIATFAFYYRDTRGPTAFEREVVANCVYLTQIAIDRHERVLEHERRAFTDALTGCPNRAAYHVALSKLAGAPAGSWALFVLDLDNLKIVNDTFGHHAGDRLLQIASHRISATVSQGQTFRVGGDEFAVILESTDALDDLGRTTAKILEALSIPADCGGHIVAPRATIGGAPYSQVDSTVECVRQNADFALYHAKETVRGGFVQYWAGLRSTMTRRMDAIRDLSSALQEDRIEAYYQPIFRLDTREIVGLEALCRMRVGDDIISAASFHEGTADAQVATSLTARMMALVAADLRRWLDLGIPFQHVGINVSSADLSGGAVERVLTAAFKSEGVPLDHVILEITETVYMGRGDQVIQEAIRALRAIGIRVALDDFGTGFASLTHLLTVPVDIIKIDKMFVDHLELDGVSGTIVEGLIRTAKKMGIRIVAEGIETEEQVDQLRAIGCVLGQGYIFSPAVDRDAATALLLEHGQRASRRADTTKSTRG